jgi:mRNA interferase RelE/StbE
MDFEIEFKPRAWKDIASLHSTEARRVVARIETLRKGLAGDIKRLTNFTPEYRLRVGSYRVLFQLEEKKIIIYRILHRKDAYR